MRPELSPDECRGVLERVGIGHLAFARRAHVDAVPVRFILAGAWIYFRASALLRHDIAGNRWALIAVTDAVDETHFANVVARGACYSAEETGSATSDAVALDGILRLRDSADAVAAGRPGIERRTQTVFRMHVDTLSGRSTFVPEHAIVDDHPRVRTADAMEPFSTAQTDGEGSSMPGAAGGEAPLVA